MYGKLLSCIEYLSNEMKIVEHNLCVIIFTVINNATELIAKKFTKNIIKKNVNIIIKYFIVQCTYFVPETCVQ